MTTPPLPEWHSALIGRLRSGGSVFAEDEARLLVAAASSADELESMAERRITGEPLEYILGWAEFCGLRVSVVPGVFVPRRRTGYLVDRAAKLSGAGSVVVDLCCGTGAVGAALRSKHPGIELYAADVDADAVHCAARNLGPGSRVFHGDLFDALPAELRGRVDVLVANAPYVPTDAIAMMPPEARVHEARVALDGGVDGLDVHRRVAMGAPDWLAPGGSVLVEASSRQAPVTASLFESAGLSARITSSKKWDATVVIATKPAVTDAVG